MDYKVAVSVPNSKPHGQVDIIIVALINALPFVEVVVIGL